MSETERRKGIKDLDMQTDHSLSTKLQKQTQDKRQEILQAMRQSMKKSSTTNSNRSNRFDLISNQLQYTNPKHDISRRVTENEASD